MPEPQSILGDGHRHRYAFCDVTYWNGNLACSSTDEWTRCLVEKRARHSYTTVECLNNDVGIRMRDCLLDMLTTAFELGREDAKQEIRRVLGVAL
jgi:hypothetical protein